MQFFPNLADLAKNAGEWKNVRYLDTWTLRGDHISDDGTFFTLDEETSRLSIINEDDTTEFTCFLADRFCEPFRNALHPINSPEDF